MDGAGGARARDISRVWRDGGWGRDRGKKHGSYSSSAPLEWSCVWWAAAGRTRCAAVARPRQRSKLLLGTRGTRTGEAPPGSRATICPPGGCVRCQVYVPFGQVTDSGISTPDQSHSREKFTHAGSSVFGVFGCVYGTPTAEMWVFGDNFRSALFAWGNNGVVTSDQPHEVAPPAGFCGSMRRSHPQHSNFISAQ